jgi:2-succinyl-5-enolpyruvyl-6-hydroxy-3-cyclohexene-1-carboxylate synthase
LPACTKVFANIGTDGIDGCMSTFLGQAYISEKLSFLIIGDLSFFYDMNSIRIRHIKHNVRILLINNKGGGEFYIGPRPDTLDAHIAARHTNTARGWVESVGFTYISARTQEEYLAVLDQFVTIESEKPIVFEVFTDMKTDADVIQVFFKTNRGILSKDDVVERIKGGVRSVLGGESYTSLKNTVGHILKR